MTISATKAKRIIHDLLDAGHETALVGCQDGGEKVDIVWSRIKGNSCMVMTIEEAERRTDRAIQAAYRALTGERVIGDPFEFITK